MLTFCLVWWKGFVNNTFQTFALNHREEEPPSLLEVLLDQLVAPPDLQTIPLRICFGMRNGGFNPERQKVQPKMWFHQHRRIGGIIHFFYGFSVVSHINERSEESFTGLLGYPTNLYSCCLYMKHLSFKKSEQIYWNSLLWIIKLFFIYAHNSLLLVSLPHTLFWAFFFLHFFNNTTKSCTFCCYLGPTYIPRSL